MTFSLTANPEKSNDKIFEKIFFKKIYFWPFWANFAHFGKIVCFKTELCQFLDFTITYHHAKKQKKLKTKTNLKTSMSGGSRMK